MDSEDICNFCLGGSTEIPPFGTARDAQDLLHPCSTCSLVAHKKCLIEWFNSIPYENLKVVHARCIHDVVIKKRSRSPGTNGTEDHSAHDDHDDHVGGHNDNLDANVTDTEDLATAGEPELEVEAAPRGNNNNNNSFLTFSIPDGFLGGMVSGVGIAEISIGLPNMTSNGLVDFPENSNILSPDDRQFEATEFGNIYSPNRNRSSNDNAAHFTNVIAEIKDQRHDPEKCNNRIVALVFVPCPQCKQAIVFQMDRSQTIAFRESVKAITIRMVQYSGITLGIFSAITGVILTGYLGLTAIGINTMRSIVPNPILILLLMKKPFKIIPRQPTVVQQPAVNWKNENWLTVLQESAHYLYRMANGINHPPHIEELYNGITDNIDNLQDAVIEGVVDPSSFNRIPALPVIMYRMRGSSLLECLFSKGDWRDNLSKIGTELLISTYLSSWGAHKLGGLLARTSWKELVSWPFWKTVFLKNPDYILGTLMPLRWLYDVWFRLVVNRIHFRLTLQAVPRDIYNKFRNALQLELISLQMGRIELENYIRVFQPQTNISWRQSLMLLTLLLFRYNALRCKYWYYETLAILAKDYSSTMSSQSLIIKSIITTAWPFVSSYVGRIMYRLLTTQYSDRLAGVPRANVLLVSNIIGLCVVVGLKDLVNLYQAYKMSNRIKDVQIITWTKDSNDTSGVDSVNGTVETEELVGFPGLFPR